VAKPVASITATFLADMSALNYLARAKSSSGTMRGWVRYLDSPKNKAETVRLRLGLPAASEKNNGCPKKP